ncbi:diguanylate cyclase (GGDEF) domain-containing protein [Allopseudospirillum japonicum]|uniref:Diguanylate cyclase (GGDEF) domain-containing protein n=1 Tax=Allopseudospirillum japonicum TaxID=64971 RepID=A0A1H6QKN3_9GAMM|nr:GGDEF domain-containing protein [Allopseudospirillum japonicum]SEI39855.1 diguanylate cyclase (GGDEF) domain-containing protein [Allopseudospirillum japonicum]
MIDHNDIFTIIKRQLISTFFQPIVESSSQEVVAFEALSRGPSDSRLHAPMRLFDEARQKHCLFALENACRQKAIESFTRQQLQGKLFINVTPDTLLQADHRSGQTLDLLKNYQMTPEQVVIELTEHTPMHDFSLMRHAVRHYQDMGFAIALDDLGTGYSSLRLWSELSPNYVKVDRHFVNHIHQDKVKRDFVRFIVEIARAVGSQLIAEGIETQEEYITLRDLGVDYMQGYYFARPQPTPQRRLTFCLPEQEQRADITAYGEQELAAVLVHEVTPVHPQMTVAEVAEIFHQHPDWYSLPVIAHKRPLGLVVRARLFNQLTRPFGQELFGKKPISQLMESHPLCVEKNTRLEQVSQLVTSRVREYLEDDFIITHEEEYLGVGQVIDLLKKITDLQVKSAQHANPLTMLPGNVPIQACIEQRIKQAQSCVVAYLDLDSFKPFNDVYGYAKGDEVLLLVASLLKKYACPNKDFVGHVGGDDFIVVYSSPDWKTRLADMLEDFSRRICGLYTQEHQKAGGIMTCDRYGQERFFPLISISVAAIQADTLSVNNAHELSSHLSHVKHKAKSTQGNCVVLQTQHKMQIIFPPSEMCPPTYHLDTAKALAN